MSDKNHQANHDVGEKSLDTASVAVFHKVRKLSKVQLITLALLAIALVAIGIAAYGQLSPALKVGKYSYSKERYSQLVTQAENAGVNKDDARKALTKALASKEAADRLKVTYLTDTVNLNEAARYEFKLSQDSTKINDYQRETAVYRIVEANVRLETAGGYKVSAVYLPFARYIYGFESNSKTAKSANLDLIGNADAVTLDMSYAYKKGEELRGAYESKKKTSVQVIQTALDDKVSSYGKAVRPASRLLVARDQTLQNYQGDVSQYLQGAQFSLIEANKAKLGKASGLTEELVSPEGVAAIPAIMRGNQMAVGYYFIIVDEVVQKNDGIQNKYDKLATELTT